VDASEPRKRGVAIATYFMAFDLGMGSGSLVWGFVLQHGGFLWIYSLSAGVATLAALAVKLRGSVSIAP